MEGDPPLPERGVARLGPSGHCNTSPLGHREAHEDQKEALQKLEGGTAGGQGRTRWEGGRSTQEGRGLLQEIDQSAEMSCIGAQKA
jgi:hypothetical protein